MKVFRWRDRCVKVTSEGAVLVGPADSAHRSMAKAPKQVRDYLADHGWNPEREAARELSERAATVGDEPTKEEPDA